jgi:hypothetical protein
MGLGFFKASAGEKNLGWSANKLPPIPIEILEKIIIVPI